MSRAVPPPTAEKDDFFVSASHKIEQKRQKIAVVNWELMLKQSTQSVTMA
jgi:hypothetical protein